MIQPTVFSFPRNAEIFTPQRMMEAKLLKKQEMEDRKPLLYAVVPVESIPEVPENPLVAMQAQSHELDMLRLKMTRKALTQLQVDNPREM